MNNKPQTKEEYVKALLTGIFNLTIYIFLAGLTIQCWIVIYRMLE